MNLPLKIYDGDKLQTPVMIFNSYESRDIEAEVVISKNGEEQKRDVVKVASNSQASVNYQMVGQLEKIYKDITLSSEKEDSYIVKVYCAGELIDVLE